jgi:hypothetical protein
MIGRFVDDYGIEYTISEQVWLMAPNQKFHILQWKAEGQYLLARNDADNQSAGNLYSRIDYLAFDQDMEPYQWGFCYSSFEAKSVTDARQAAVADRENPKTGCNGHPFSRMKPIEE